MAHLVAFPTLNTYVVPSSHQPLIRPNRLLCFSANARQPAAGIVGYKMVFLKILPSVNMSFFPEPVTCVIKITKYNDVCT